MAFRYDAVVLFRRRFRRFLGLAFGKVLHSAAVALPGFHELPTPVQGLLCHKNFISRARSDHERGEGDTSRSRGGGAMPGGGLGPWKSSNRLTSYA